jgi:cellulose biosynthesis protein BcsQ
MLKGAERKLMRVAGAPYRLADPLSRIASHYAAIVIDTRPSFSLMTEMGLIAATDAIVPVEPHYLETVGLMSVSENTKTGMRSTGALTTLRWLPVYSSPVQKSRHSPGGNATVQLSTPGSATGDTNRSRPK